MDAGLARLMYNICSAASGFGIGVSGFLQFQLGCKKLQSRQKCNKGKELGVHIHICSPLATPLPSKPHNSFSVCVCGFFPSASMCVHVHSFGPARLGKNANFLANAI